MGNSIMVRSVFERRWIIDANLGFLSNSATAPMSPRSEEKSMKIF